MTAPTNLFTPGNSKWGLYLPTASANTNVAAAASVLATGVFSTTQQAWMDQAKQLSVGVFLEWSAGTIGSPVALAQFEWTLHGSTLWNQVFGCARTLTGTAGAAGALAFEFDWNSVPQSVEQFRIAWYNATLSAGVNEFTIASARTFLILQRKK